jgi:hypothetical protein
MRVKPKAKCRALPIGKASTSKLKKRLRSVGRLDKSTREVQDRGKTRKKKQASAVEVIDAKCPERECYVCERGGINLVRITAEKFRHSECYPGSPLWCEWYEKNKSQRTDVGDMLLKHGKGEA